MSALAKFPFCWVEGDCFPEIVCTFQDQDLTGFSVTLHLRRKDESVVIKNAIAIYVVQGPFKFSWAVGYLIAGFN